MEKHFIIATAGHVDHGKSALVQTLTGTDPDRLPEEKARGITIDLGFAELNLVAPNGEKIHAGIVDVPGHEDFVRNMIAGVGSIDLALFVIAADDGWMPQTEEHLQILTLLGVKHAVVALTKMDLAAIDIEQIRDHLRETPFAEALIVPTSIRSGQGIENLGNALTIALEKMQPQRDYGKPRLFIDRVFTLRGIGTVVTGTLTGGILQQGQKIIIQPKNREARIRSLHSHGRELDFAEPGMRTAINLPDVDLEQLQRGDMITIVDLGRPSAKLLVQLSALGAIKNGASVYLHHGTSRVFAKITALEKDGLAQLKLASPISAFLGDRFVLRDPSERYTIGGGVVLDPDGKCALSLWRGLSEAPPQAADIGLCIRAELAACRFAPKNSLLRKSHFSSAEIADSLRRLESTNEIAVRREFAIDRNTWDTLIHRTSALIDAAHRHHPERAGLELSELRTSFRDVSDEIFEALTTDLCASDCVRSGSVIARATHRPFLSPQLQPLAQKITAFLAEKPFDPPGRKEIAGDRQSQQALRFLIQNGAVVEIGPDILLLGNSFAKMKAAALNFIAERGPATVSELRRALGSSRRVMVPFLEKLDRDGVTVRLGEKRRLR